MASTPSPSRTTRISRCTSTNCGAPSGSRATSATSSRIEFVPQSMAATRMACSVIGPPQISASAATGSAGADRPGESHDRTRTPATSQHRTRGGPGSATRRRRQCADAHGHQPGADRCRLRRRRRRSRAARRRWPPRARHSPPSCGRLAVDAGSAEIIEAVRLADTHPPVLRTHDRAGHRIDEVEYHPAWHTLMTRAVGAGLQAAPWAPDAGEQRPPAPRRRLLPLDADRVRAPVPRSR